MFVSLTSSKGHCSSEFHRILVAVQLDLIERYLFLMIFQLDFIGFYSYLVSFPSKKNI